MKFYRERGARNIQQNERIPFRYSRIGGSDEKSFGISRLVRHVVQSLPTTRYSRAESTCAINRRFMLTKWNQKWHFHGKRSQIAGDANEDQIITAGMVYMNRPKILQRVLSDFFHFSRHDSCTNIFKVLEIILLALNTYAQEKQIQISGRYVRVAGRFGRLRRLWITHFDRFQRGSVLHRAWQTFQFTASKW